MTHAYSVQQKPDAQFLAQANSINSQCHQHQTDWGIDGNRLADYDHWLDNANSAYALNNDKVTKTAITSANKKAAFGELKHFQGPFIDYLEVNTKVPDAALEAMGLRSREHHAHQPLPRPDKPPVISVVKLHDELTVYAAQPEHDQPTAGVAPTRYHAFMIRIRMEGEDKYQTVVSTRLHHTLFFERTDEGKRLYLSAAWVNPRLEAGPWCEEISEIIG
ncbi:MAG: hypothetical protein LBF69_07735 [Prevotellaceae bacterium]|jgi:hypothetical protein|nr:hypothetical protein [Prevotellaceae bacterium]